MIRHNQRQIAAKRIPDNVQDGRKRQVSVPNTTLLSWQSVNEVEYSAIIETCYDKYLRSMCMCEQTVIVSD